jgi:hypothetical protein
MYIKQSLLAVTLLTSINAYADPYRYPYTYNDPYKASALNYENNKFNWDNNPLNQDNNALTDGKNVLRDEYGRAQGYMVVKPDGDANIYDTKGNRLFYVPKK